MALPYAFAGVTRATGAQLDANFAALGALTPIPCTASGSNTITLAQNANTPAISAYSNYMQFTAVAAQTNTGAATGKVGALATLSIYKPSPAGPVALTGGEIVAGTALTLLYDSALNGFHLMSPLFAFSQMSASIASISRISIGGGQQISRVFSTTASISWPQLAPSTTAESIIALGGCSVGDIITLGYPASIAALISYRAYVPSAGSVALVAQNFSSSTITPVAGSYRVAAQGFA